MTTNYYEAWELEVDKDRIVDLYNQLVDLTENKRILTYSRYTDKLNVALELMEYILGNDPDNPINNWFDLE